MPWNSRIFFATALSCAYSRPCDPDPVNRLLEQLEIGGDAVVGGIVAGERLGEVEDQVAVDARKGVQALDRPVEDVQRGVVSELAERLRDFVLDFLLVEGSRQRRLLRRSAAGFLRLLPAIVEDENVQFAHE